MSDELIPYFRNNFNGSEVNTVNARDLHRVLEVGREFSHWIKARIKKAMLQENLDYILLAKSDEQNFSQRGGHNKVDYFLSLYAAKHIAMLEGRRFIYNLLKEKGINPNA